MAEALIQAASFPASVGEKSGKLEGTAKTQRATQMMWSGQSHSLRIQGFMGLRGSNTLDMMRRSGPDFHSKVAAALSAARGKPSRAVTVAMFERFTVKGISVISFAQDEARRLGHNFVDTEHILLGLTREGTGISAKVLNSMGINLEVARVEVAKIIIRGTGPVALEIPFTARANRVLDFSMEEARELGAEVAAQAQRKERCMGEFILNVDELLPVTESLRNDSYSSSSIGKMSSTEVSLLDAFIAPGFVSSEHLLLGLLREGEGVAARVLENLGADTHSIRTQVMLLVSENTDAAGEGIGGSSG